MTKYLYYYDLGSEIISLSFSKSIPECSESLVQATFKKALKKRNIDIYEHISKLGFEARACNICKKEHNPYINLRFRVNENMQLIIFGVWYGMRINGKINYDRHYCYGKNIKCPGLFMNSNSIEYVSATLAISKKKAKEFIHRHNKSPFYLENHGSAESYSRSQARGLEFFIKKYGAEIGQSKFEKYNSTHVYWSSKQYQIDKFGEKIGSAIWEELSKVKAQTLANFQMRFGSDIGLDRFNKWKSKISSTNSQIIEKFGYEKGIKFIESRNSKSAETKMKNSGITIIPKELRLDYLIYQYLVWDETHESLLRYSHLKFGSDFNKKGLSLDHQISIKFGFMNGLSPTVIGHIENLRYITKAENSKKRDTCNISIDELISKIKSYNEH